MHIQRTTGLAVRNYCIRAWRRSNQIDPPLTTAIPTACHSHSPTPARSPFFACQIAHPIQSFPSRVHCPTVPRRATLWRRRHAISGTTAKIAGCGPATASPRNATTKRTQAWRRVLNRKLLPMFDRSTRFRLQGARPQRVTDFVYQSLTDNSCHSSPECANNRPWAQAAQPGPA